MSCQYPDNFGQSQNICVWSPTRPQPLQQWPEVPPNFEETRVVLKNLILTFHSNSFQVWLFVALCSSLHDSSHFSSEMIVFISNSHFSLTPKLSSMGLSCSILFSLDIQICIINMSITDFFFWLWLFACLISSTWPEIMITNTKKTSTFRSAALEHLCPHQCQNQTCSLVYNFLR